jgi:hypothetical protein
MVGISFGLRENVKAVVPGAQTERQGEAAPFGANPRRPLL